MTRVTTTRTVDGHRLMFTWHGGAYIEIARVGFPPSEVINVWDHATNRPRIERTREAFNTKVDAWIADYGPDRLAHDVKENW